MSNKTEILNAIKDKGLVPLYYNDSAEESLAILESLYQAGIRGIEYTNRGASALSNFEQLKKRTTEKYKDLYLGIGTIKTKEQAQSFLDAGADFIISPGIPAEVAAFASAKNIFWIPGCMTPTEIIQAEAYGINFVKIFPGNILGPSYVQSIRDLFPEMQFMPTGGVEPTRENISSWFNAGVVAVGMGSQLISKTAIQSKNYSLIKENTQKALDFIKEWKSNKQ